MTDRRKSLTPRVVATAAELREALAPARAAGQTVGLVPTMGALHAGHLSLVDAAAAECDCNVVTIFVNPTQFSAGEDFQRYPRALAHDLALLAGHGVDLVFAPTKEAMYPGGFATLVGVDSVATEFEGRCRPGHFSGVATVVLKLLMLSAPHVAYFGQKDYQQVLVVRRLVEDLNVPCEIRVVPTVREPDGLAMSSRNAYLGPAERRAALGVIDALRSAAALIAAGQRDPLPILRRMRERLQHFGLEPIDYAALVNPVDLRPLREIRGVSLGLVAAYAGSTRLIDNLLIGPDGHSIDPPPTGPGPPA